MADVRRWAQMGPAVVVLTLAISAAVSTWQSCPEGASSSLAPLLDYFWAGATHMLRAPLQTLLNRRKLTAIPLPPHQGRPHAHRNLPLWLTPLDL